MRALIDSDIFCYEFGNMIELETGGLLPWEITRSLVDARIDQILTAVEATEASFYLTDSKSNFRNQVATILPYKGHRPTEKPPHWKNIRQHLIDNYDAEIVYGMEADDACGIAQWKNFMGNINTVWDVRTGELTNPDCLNTIICSRDKDLSMIPGWHYSWECGNQKERKWFIDETDAIRFFYKQLLTGDSTDNILGLYKVGDKASCVKVLDQINNESDMFDSVAAEYKARFGSYWDRFLYENAALLWIKRDDSTHSSMCFEEEIYSRLDGFMGPHDTF